MTKKEVAHHMPHIGEVAGLDRRGWPVKPWDVEDWIILHECLSEAKRRMAERRNPTTDKGATDEAGRQVPAP